MKKSPLQSVPPASAGPMRLLLLLLVGGGLGCSLFSDAEETTQRLEVGQGEAQRVDLKAGTVAALAVSPGWSFTGAYATCHNYYDPEATLLPSGKVLITGGSYSGSGISDLRCVEVYDPATGAWSTTGFMQTGRTYHTATLLPSGKVLVAGGEGSCETDCTGLRSAEVYDPATGEWSPTGSMVTARYWHTATLLANGKVLVSGGYNESSGTLKTAEVYDPVSGSWTATGSMSSARRVYTATLLPDGRVLATGGYYNGSGSLATAEVYDPASGSWTATAPLNFSRSFHTATLMPNGRVLVSGGLYNGSSPLVQAEVYDPVSRSWGVTAPLNTSRFGHTATLLPNGKVLVAGGGGPNGPSSTRQSAEVYDPATGAWSLTGSLVIPRYRHTATLLRSGNVLVSGAYQRAEVYAALIVEEPAYDSATSNITPTYRGGAEPGSAITLIVDDSPVGDALADGTGQWSFTPTTALAEGLHTVRATAKDAAGNITAHSSPNAFRVDTVPPAAPVVDEPANGSLLRSTPTYSGRAEANSTVTLIVDDLPVGNALADGAGQWNFWLTRALDDGPHTVQATAKDAAGNASASSSSNAFQVDTTPPAPPVMVFPANGSAIRDSTPTYRGTSEAGSTVILYVDSRFVREILTDAAGQWSFTPIKALAEGSHIVWAEVSDAAGNGGSSSSINAFRLDTAPPAAPGMVEPANGSLLGDNTPTYRGFGEEGSFVVLIVDDLLLGETLVDAANRWSFSPTTVLADGSYTVWAVAKDEAGNTSAKSSANAFSVDTVPPTAPILMAPDSGSIIGDRELLTKVRFEREGGRIAGP